MIHKRINNVLLDLSNSNSFRVIIALLILQFVPKMEAQAQNEEGTTAISVNIGIGPALELVKVGLNQFNDVDASATMVRGATIDYAISDYFSIGIAASRQLLDATFSNSYISEKTNERVPEIAELNAKRTHFSIRPLFHYLGDEKLDLYSGVRVGWTHLGVKYITDDPDLEDKIKLGGGRPTFGLVALGARYFLIPNVGANVDLQIGAPYVVSAGLSVRF